MIRPVDSEASVSYLTLSVFAQSVVERLVDPPSESADERTEFLDRVIRLLRSVRSSDRFSAEMPGGLRPFRDYEQVGILYEVLTPSREQAEGKLDEQIKILETLRDAPQDVDEQTRELVVAFFDRLATKALYRSRHPADSIPPGVHELCR